MSLKILIIGKNSFIGINIYEKLKKKLDIVKLSFDTVKIKNESFFKQFQFIINCSINHNYISKKYNALYDFDLILAHKVKFTDCRYVFISSRKVYYPKFNITEESRTNPKNHYGKNKLITEKKLQELLNSQLLIMRTSNILGLKKKNKRRIHNTFLDFFYQNITANKVILYNNCYKDFLSINQFVNILFLLIKKKAYGVVNVSLGKKVYLTNIVKWLNYFNTKDVEHISVDKGMNCDSFTLNNNRLKKIINYKILVADLKKDCLEISKKIFLKK